MKIVKLYAVAPRSSRDYFVWAHNKKEAKAIYKDYMVNVQRLPEFWDRFKREVIAREVAILNDRKDCRKLCGPHVRAMLKLTSKKKIA
jgi:hypothetical protein